jgi:hypothetical protein
MPSSRISCVPFAQQICSYFVLRWYPRSGTGNRRSIVTICSRSTSGNRCDPRCCPCAPAHLSIRHCLPGCAPVPGVIGDPDRDVARFHRLSGLRGSCRRPRPRADHVGPRPRHHRRTARRARHRSHAAPQRTTGASLLDDPTGQMTRASHRDGRHAAAYPAARRGTPPRAPRQRRRPGQAGPAMAAVARVRRPPAVASAHRRRRAP